MPEPTEPGPGFEDDLVHALRAAGTAFHPDRERLVRGGAARGRQLGRRRTATAVGAAAALALTVTGVAVLTTTPRPGAVTAAPPGPASTAPTTPEQQMVTLLAQQLPAGLTVRRSEGTATGPGDVLGGLQRAEISVDDGKGATLVSLVVNRRSPGSKSAGCPMSNSPKDDCRTESLPDGSTLAIGRIAPPDGDTSRIWRVALAAPDGLLVSVDENNFADMEHQDVTRPEPLLTLEQLRAVVTAPVWQAVGAQVSGAAATGPSAGPGAPVPIDRMGPALNGLLPAGLKKGNSSVSTGYANVHVSNGAEQTVLDVQARTADAATTAAFADAPALPDGTRIRTVEARPIDGSQGAVENVVDALRPDGLHIRVRALNPSGQGAAAGHPPLLTVDQLRTIAVSPNWTAG